MNEMRRPVRGDEGRLRALDALRLMCALWVAIFHFLSIKQAERIWGQEPSQVFPNADFFVPYGWLGVEVFFIISGFVICMSSWGRSLGDFFRSRVTRLYPAYWAGVVLTFVIVYFTPQVTKSPSFSDAIVNLTMLQEPLGAAPVDGVYWTLWAEMRFYLLFAIVVWWGVTYRRVVAFALIWTIASALADGADSELLNLVAMPKYAHYFLVGVGLYLIHRFGHQLLAWIIVGVNFLLAYHYSVLRMHHETENVILRPLDAEVVGLILLGSVLLILAIARGRLAWVKWRWVSYAGALTYPFYLVHDRIGRALIYWLHERAELTPYIVLPATLAATLLLAWLVHVLVEKPLSRWLKLRLTRRGALDLDPPDLLAAERPVARESSQVRVPVAG